MSPRIRQTHSSVGGLLDDIRLWQSGDVHLDWRMPTVDALFEELERWNDSPGLCAAFNPEGLHLIVMTRAHYFSCCTRIENRALKRVPSFAIVLLAGTADARVFTFEQFKRAVSEEQEGLGSRG